MDIWEANRMATSFTAHPCDHEGQQKCYGKECGDTNKGEHYQSICDKDGCQFNPYRLGDHDFYGMGKIVDTTLPITVVTQFVTEDGTDDGDLTEIRRYYMQGGFVIPNTAASIGGMSGNSMEDGFCKAQKSSFNRTRTPNNQEGSFDQFSQKGGLGSIGGALGRGMVLAFSIWDDPNTKMHWLDSISPRDMDESVPGVKRGPCERREGDAGALRSSNGDGYVEFSRIKYGTIGSTLAQLSSAQRKFAKGPVQEPGASASARLRLASLAPTAAAGFLAAVALVAFARHRFSSYRAAQKTGIGRVMTGRVPPPYSSLLEAVPLAGTTADAGEDS
jgi:cellulose 1,4-beta-cellobiosidase